MGFFLSQDNSKKWYVVPASHRLDWMTFLDMSSDVRRPLKVPTWALPIASPDRVIFPSFTTV